jgi:hypothetical protein
MRIGFLALGAMGTPIALRLLAAGHELSVWNRTEGRTKPLLREGAIAAATPAEAELGADVLVTVFPHDAAYDEILFGSHRLIDALSPGLLHILCGTISAALAQRLIAEHATRSIDLVLAQISGTPTDAANGQLNIVATGTPQAIARAIPILESFSQEISVHSASPQSATPSPPGSAI